MRIERIRVGDWITLADSLVRAHWEELAKNKQLMRLKPDLDLYGQLERAGRVVALGVFDDLDTLYTSLVGYSVSFLAQHPHYVDLTVCQNDVLYLDPKHRTGRTGVRLLQETEREARAAGAAMMIWHAKQGTPLDAMLPRMGYGVQDILYAKEL